MTNGTSGSGDQVTGFGYDNTGQLTTITDPDAITTTLKYDAAHRLTDVVDALGDTVHYTLDNAGNRTQEDTKDPSGNLKHSIERVYNALGQLQDVANAGVANPATNPTYAFTYDANGNPNQTTDGRGIVSQTSVDALNRVITQVGDVGTGHINATTQIGYDALDRITQVTDPHGLNTGYQFDGLNDLTQLASPDTGTTTATFDAAGNALTKTDARGTLVSYTYDALNRVTKATYPNHAYNTTYQYDTTNAICDQTTQIYNKGHLTHIVDFSGQTVFCYDRFGRVAAKAEILDDLDFATQYSYSLGNRLLQETLPHTGTVISYTRDALGRVSAVTYHTPLHPHTETPVVNSVSYYPFGPIATIGYANGRTLNRTYDQDYVVSAISDTGTGGLNLSFGRDVLGNLTQISSGASGNVLGYDGLNRLTSVIDLSSNPVWAYTYDTTGNRLSKQQGTATAVPYTYPTTSHQLQAVGSYGRSYDAMGNTTSSASATGTLNFSYDPTGRMSQVANASNTVLMQYGENALGQRVEKYLTGTNADTILIEHDEAGRVIGDYNYTGARIDETIWMDGMPIALLSGTAGTLSYIEPDQLGTPRVAIDGTSNAATWTWSPINDPFGETQPTGTLSLNLRMPGQSYDAESGLNYNYFRDYDSATDRYLQSDPTGLNGGISTYSYVAGNPVTGIDPTGLVLWIFGDSKYRSKVNKIKKRVHNSCPQLAGRLNILESSPYIHIIVPLSWKPHTPEAGPPWKPATSPDDSGGKFGTPANSVTFYDPDEVMPADYAAPPFGTPEGVFAHEVGGHVFDLDQGINSSNPELRELNAKAMEIDYLNGNH